MMKGIYLYMTMCIAAIASTACTNELEESTVPTDNALVLTVGDYPAFSEGTNTRVGTFDPGKTAWEEGDRILVSVTSSSSNQYATLTYENNTWTPSQTLTRPSGTYTINTWYAPAYEWNNGTLTLSSGKTAGMDEFLATTSSNGIITFTTNDRSYSRLRIAGASSINLNVSISNFTPAGNGTSSSTTNAILTTDSKGNAYLYGTWTSGSNITVKYGNNTTLANKNVTANPDKNKSYVVDASFTNVSNANSWNSIGDGTEQFPYVLLNANQLKSLSDKSQDNQNISEHFRLESDISLSGNWTPIGTAESWQSDGKFMGTFDGGGHIITGLTCEGSVNFFGLFRIIEEGGIVKNLTLADCNISTTGEYVGGIAAISYTNIENCHIKNGKISGESSVGGIVGQTSTGCSIIACSNTAEVSGNSSVGGIVGEANRTNITACYNTGPITGSSNIGTITGYRRNQVVLTDCYWLENGTVTGNSGGTTWEDAIINMNNTLQSAGYDYQYEMGADNLPEIKPTNQSQ